MTPNQNLDLAASPEIQEKFNWRPLLRSLKRKKIVPILGANLFYINDERSNKVPLYEHMHRELLKEIDSANQDDDFWEFMEKNKTDLPILITDFMEENQESIDKTPLIKLAACFVGNSTLKDEPFEF